MLTTVSSFGGRGFGAGLARVWGIGTRHRRRAWQPSVMSSLTAETVGHVRVLRLDRPERKNALTSSLGWGIVRAVGEAHDDDDVRVVAITGNGDAFCSGLDLGGGDGDVVDTGLSDQELVLDEKGWVGRFLLALRFETDKPVVAGLNGVAVGAGLSLAMAADIRIAADTARLHPGYLRAGTSPDGGLTWSLPTLVGHETALRFLLESRFVGADEALRLGLVSEVVPADQLEARMVEFCHAIAAQAPLAVRRTKRLVARTPLITDVDGRMVDEIRNALAGLSSEDGQEAVQAIIEKRAPEFRGR
jgi:2-(1,2-epoxy-1,2-dihydrophenyl)acetyl-CoA isomerase